MSVPAEAMYPDVVVRSGFRGYNREVIMEAISEMVDRTGGWPGRAVSGARVLLKVNMLSAKSPERGITTHPEVAAAVGLLLKARGCDVFVGDSPGGAVKGVERYWKNCGFLEMSRETGIGLVNFESSGSRRVEVRGRSYNIAVPVIEGFDVRINLCKFKTHSYCRITNAVKNSFGIVPGLGKAMLHTMSPRPCDLAVNIVDLYEIAGFDLHISDAIIAMDGRGPSTDGTPRPDGVIALARDGVCLDAAMCEMAGLPPLELDTTREARRRGLGKAPEEIVTDGVHRFENFRIPGKSWLNSVPPFMGTVVRALLRVAPRSNEKCTGCGFCARSCPVDAIVIKNNRAVMKRGRCIMCLCCHELCPENAVEIKSFFLRKTKR
ncbi:MAG: DUF362 domain-containing protein [Candidatus Fermentibacteraceae bacterium]